jgi:hypothetical protein
MLSEIHTISVTDGQVTLEEARRQFMQPDWQLLDVAAWSVIQMGYLVRKMRLTIHVNQDRPN